MKSSLASLSSYPCRFGWRNLHVAHERPEPGVAPRSERERDPRAGGEPEAVERAGADVERVEVNPGRARPEAPALQLGVVRPLEAKPEAVRPGGAHRLRHGAGGGPEPEERDPCLRVEVAAQAEVALQRDLAAGREPPALRRGQGQGETRLDPDAALQRRGRPGERQQRQDGERDGRSCQESMRDHEAMGVPFRAKERSVRCAPQQERARARVGAHEPPRAGVTATCALHCGLLPR